MSFERTMAVRMLLVGALPLGWLAVAACGGRSSGTSQPATVTAASASITTVPAAATAATAPAAGPADWISTSEERC